MPYGIPRDDSPMLGFKGAQELEQEAEERRSWDENIEDEQVVSDLAGYVQSCWIAAKHAKEMKIEPTLFRSLRQRIGEYDPEILSAIESKHGSKVYMMLTDEKCSAAESWLEDILMPVDDRPFGVKPTPIPEMDEEVVRRIEEKVSTEAYNLMMQQGIEPTEEEIDQRKDQLVGAMTSAMNKQAREEAEKLEEELANILEGAEWRIPFRDFLFYFVTFKAAFLEGPIIRQKPVLKWRNGIPVTEIDFVKEYDAVSPFDIYPSPTATGMDDGYLIKKHRLTRSHLYSLRGVEGYLTDVIDELLEDLSDGGNYNWLDYSDNTRDNLEGRERKDDDPEGKIDALQFWGEVPGDKLLDWGMTDLTSEKDYSIELWLIKDKIIKAVLNPNPLGRKPIFKASFRELSGQFWGIGLPEVIRDSQVMCNASARNLADNMAIAAGPQIGVDISTMPEGENYTDIFPLKVWPFDLSQGPTSAGGRQPIWFFAPPSYANELIAVYTKFSEEADTKSGIPRYAYGSRETGGPLSTATGFSMMMDNAARGIKKVVRNIDQGIIKPMIMHLYQWCMLYEEGFNLRYAGDIQIIARGSSALVAKEQKQVRLVELLQLILASPHLSQLAGMPGIADVFRKVLQGADVGIDDVIPSDAEIQAMAQAPSPEAEQAGQAQTPGPPMGRARNYAGETL